MRLEEIFRDKRVNDLPEYLSIIFCIFISFQYYFFGIIMNIWLHFNIFSVFNHYVKKVPNIIKNM